MTNKKNWNVDMNENVIDIVYYHRIHFLELSTKTI